MIPKFKEIIANHHQHMKDWKAEKKKKVVGYLCTYMPEEIVYAAGVVPVRIIAGDDPTILAERYMAQWTCPFSRGCLEEALKGEYDYLDAVVYPWTCSHTHTSFYYMGQHMPGVETYLISPPKTLERAGAKPFLTAELAAFRDWLEKFAGTAVSDEDLERGIEICNSSRRLMRQVYNLRKEDPPPLSGLEALDMVLSNQLTDKEEHNRILSHWLAEAPNRSDRRQAGVRLMVVGSCVDKPEVLKLIEGMGANVVIDDLCTGTRYFWDEVKPDSDPLSAISQRFLDRVNCPAKLAGDRRYQHVLKLAREYDAHGVIVLHQKFCNPHGNDYPPLKSHLDQNDIPSLLLELDIPVPGGQIKNRVQTFVEMLELEIGGERG